MPRAREMKSLKGLCLDNVEKAIDNWFTRLLVDGSDSGSRFITLLSKGEDDELYECFMNWFDVLPCTLLLDVTKVVPHKFHQKDRCKWNQLLWCYLEMLLSEEIVLVNQTAEIVQGFLQVASKRCPLLKKLKVIHSPFEELIKPYNLESYISLFQKLKELNIGDPEMGDSCLEILGEFCKDLRELDVSYCQNVTDAGIAALCVGVDDLGNRNGRGLCKSIVKLWTKGTQVTNIGIQVAVKNLPNLEFCDMASIQMLTDIHKQNSLNKELEVPKYSFISLKLKKKYSSPYTSGSLKLVMSLCPHLLIVHITAISGLKDADLLCLSSVERLSELTISGCEDDSEITFDDGVIPLLEAKGRELNVLKLQDLRIPININAIVELCPNLHTLSLTGNRKYTNFTGLFSSYKRIKLDMPKLENLTSLCLGSCCATCRRTKSSIPSENLAFLLSSPLLTEIDIRHCDTLTDDIFKSAVKSNPFTHLEVLTLGGCHSITSEGVDVFMEENRIEKILLIGCNKLTLDNIFKWKVKALLMDWNLMLGCLIVRGDDYENA